MGASLGLCPTFHPRGDHSAHGPCKGCFLCGKTHSNPDFCALLPLCSFCFVSFYTKGVALYTNCFNLISDFFFSLIGF